MKKLFLLSLLSIYTLINPINIFASVQPTNIIENTIESNTKTPQEKITSSKITSKNKKEFKKTKQQKQLKEKPMGIAKGILFFFISLIPFVGPIFVFCEYSSMSWSDTSLVILCLILFPLAMFISWFFILFNE